MLVNRTQLNLKVAYSYIQTLEAEADLATGLHREEIIREINRSTENVDYLEAVIILDKRENQLIPSKIQVYV